MYDLYEQSVCIDLRYSVDAFPFRHVNQIEIMLRRRVILEKHPLSINIHLPKIEIESNQKF